VEPAIDSLIDKVDSKYSMVIVSARRARQLLAGARKKVDTPSDKPVTVALQELAAGVLRFEPKEGGDVDPLRPRVTEDPDR
jgi:DNA-directed RNA polymerase subunit omega